MQEKLDALVRTQAMQLFRQQGLHFTMQQVAEPLHISKKTIYTVYPSKEALLLDMVDHAFADIHRCKQEILAGSGTLQEKLRAVIIAMPTEYGCAGPAADEGAGREIPGGGGAGAQSIGKRVGTHHGAAGTGCGRGGSCARYPCRCCGR